MKCEQNQSIFLVWKFSVNSQFPQFRAIRCKLCGKRAFLQKSHTRKLGEISVFYAVIKSMKMILTSKHRHKSQKNTERRSGKVYEDDFEFKTQT